jgi:hypothetical protein
VVLGCPGQVFHPEFVLDRQHQGAAVGQPPRDGGQEGPVRLPIVGAAADVLEHADHDHHIVGRRGRQITHLADENASNPGL